MTIALAPFMKKHLTHAEIRNARFNQSASVFVSAKQRLEDYCNMVQGSRNELNNAIKDFKANNGTPKWSNINLVRAHKVKLADIRIDDTMNRPLDWKHVLKILRNFAATRVLAINVYEDPAAPGCYIAWDGQHTTIVLYIVSVLICQGAIGDIEVPVAITPSANKEEIRINFIVLNSAEGKLALSPLALLEQKIYGVTVDKSTNPVWEEAAAKFQALADVDIFLTSDEYRDTGESGALTHIKTIEGESLDMVQNFAKYWSFRKVHENRRVETKELLMLMNLFNAAKADGIEWDDNEIEEITNIFWNKFQCEFTGEKYLNVFWQKLDVAYDNWFDKVYRQPAAGEEDLRPTRLKMTHNGKHQDTFGTVFLIKQLAKSKFSGQLPNYKHDSNFKPAAADLW